MEDHGEGAKIPGKQCPGARMVGRERVAPAPGGGREPAAIPVNGRKDEEGTDERGRQNRPPSLPCPEPHHGQWVYFYPIRVRESTRDRVPVGAY